MTFWRAGSLISEQLRKVMFCAVSSRGKLTFKPVVNPLLSTISTKVLTLTIFKVTFCKAWLLLMFKASTVSRLLRPSKEPNPVLVIRIDRAFVIPTDPKPRNCVRGRAVRFIWSTRFNAGKLQPINAGKKPTNKPPLTSFKAGKVTWDRSVESVIVRLPSIFSILSTWIC